MTTQAKRVANTKAKVVDWGLKITPEKAAEAILVLQNYVAERVKLVESKKITTVPHAIKFMAAIQDFNKEINDRIKAPGEALYNTVRFTMVPTIFDENDVASENVNGIGSCRLQDDISVKTLDVEALHQWLTDQGQEDLIKETVNAQTLAAFLRNRMKENAEAVAAAMKAGTSDPAKLQELQKPLPGSEIATITPVVRAQLTRE